MRDAYIPQGQPVDFAVRLGWSLAVIVLDATVWLDLVGFGGRGS